MKPQKAPPRNSNQDGFEPLKEPRRSLRQQKKRPASASTPTRKHQPSNNSDAGEWTTNAEHAHGGAQKVRPFRKKIDQNSPQLNAGGDTATIASEETMRNKTFTGEDKIPAGEETYSPTKQHCRRRRQWKP